MTSPPERDAIRLSPEDNVATVLRPVAARETLRLGEGEGDGSVLTREAIPLCHKVALVAIAPGEAVTKYGEPIGRATAPIAPGHHVHVHNMRSARALSGPVSGPSSTLPSAPVPGDV